MTRRQADICIARLCRRTTFDATPNDHTFREHLKITSKSLRVTIFAQTPAGTKKLASTGISLPKQAQMFPDEDCAVKWLGLSFLAMAVNARYAKGMAPTRTRMRQLELFKGNPTRRIPNSHAGQSPEMSRACKMLDEPAAKPQCGGLTVYEANLQVSLLCDYRRNSGGSFNVNPSPKHRSNFPLPTTFAAEPGFRHSYSILTAKME